MSDLSRMLDDLYALPATDADDGFASELEPATAPSWSSDEALDEVFSSWVPGETPSKAVTLPALDLDAEPEPVPEPEPEPVRAHALVPWTPSDDDILPPRRARGRTRGRHARR